MTPGDRGESAVVVGIRTYVAYWWRVSGASEPGGYSRRPFWGAKRTRTVGSLAQGIAQGKIKTVDKVVMGIRMTEESTTNDCYNDDDDHVV